jgi:hypothetical protein
MLFHNKVAIQTKEHYIEANNLTILHWAVIYRVLSYLDTLNSKLNYVKYLTSGMGQLVGVVPNN